MNTVAKRRPLGSQRQLTVVSCGHIAIRSGADESDGVDEGSPGTRCRAGQATDEGCSDECSTGDPRCDEGRSRGECGNAGEAGCCGDEAYQTSGESDERRMEEQLPEEELVAPSDFFRA